MSWKSEWKKLTIIIAAFLGCFYLPVGISRFDNAIMEALLLVKWYAREHVLLCLIPAFFIAGAIAVFVSHDSVIKYLGPKANKFTAYAVASIFGSVLAVCSCTILPLFAGIYRVGAGLGPATAFLYSGPAINILAIILTARVLGLEIGIARVIGAVLFSVVIGLLMHLIYRRQELQKAEAQMVMPETQVTRPLWKNIIYFAAMIGILVFANWAKPVEPVGFWNAIYLAKWFISGFFAVVLVIVLMLWFKKTDFTSWTNASWDFAKQILPLLFWGVLVAGLLLGRPGHDGLIPSKWISSAVGGNSIWANLFASIAGAFMYFATLTEVPILKGLLGAGMGKGPALALLLAGPALSLPSMFVIRSIIGTQKTIVYVTLVIAMATVSGIIFGTFF